MTDVAIAVVRHQDRFLVGRRSPGTLLAGFWEFPGGKVKLGETVQEAAVRECLEETGLAVVVVGCCGDTHHRYATQIEGPEKGGALDLHLHFLACRLAGSTGCPQDPFRWAATEELIDLEFPPPNQSVIRQLMDEAVVARIWSVE